MRKHRVPTIRLIDAHRQASDLISAGFILSALLECVDDADLDLI
jgi:hypothetical protein